MTLIERWTITPNRRIGQPGDYGIALGTIEPRLPLDGERFEVVRAADYEGSVGAIKRAYELLIDPEGADVLRALGVLEAVLPESSDDAGGR